MLQSIRDKLVGWVAWGILILISVPFIFMGVTDFGSPARTTVAAEVDDEIIDQQDYQRRYQASRQNMQRQLGANYRPDLFDKQIQQNVINTMVEEKLLAMLAEKNNIQVGDKELSSVIRQDPGFKQNNKFDYNFYKSTLGQSGFTPDSYERYLRNDRKVNAIPRLIIQSHFVTPQEAERYNKLFNQKRDFDYVIVGEEHLGEEVVVQDEQAKAYYDENMHEFVRPAQVKFEYLRLSSDQLVESVDTTEESIRRYYEENAENFIVEEQRKASHILLSLEEGKTLEESPEVLGKLSEIQEKLKAGEQFEELAKAYSDDPGSAQQGGDLGQVLRGVMVPPFEEALFALQENGQISDPVRTSFGIHLIRLDELTPKQVKSFDEAKDELKEGFAKKQAIELYYDQSERMAEISYENPDSLLPVAEALDLEVESSDWLSADSDAQGVEGNKDVLRAAFSDRLKTEMTNSDPIEIGVNDVVIIRVNDSRPEFQIPFDDVIDKVRTAARKNVIDQQVSEYASQLLGRLQQGELLQTLADEEKLSLEAVDGLQRQDNKLPAGLSSGVFSMSTPGEGQSGTDTIELADGKVALVVLRNVVLPDSKDISSAEKSLASRDAARDAQMVLAGMREKAKVVIYKDKL
jgi:peptidyl-prolyl cis-trans isomerase D